MRTTWNSTQHTSCSTTKTRLKLFLCLFQCAITPVLSSPPPLGWDHGRVNKGMTARIVGGQETLPHEYPFVLSLREYGKHLCGASLIAPLWALTAAHCIDPDPETPAAIYSLDIHRHDLSIHASRDHTCTEVVLASEIVCHPQYSKETLENDICLIKLAQTPRCAHDIALPVLDLSDAAVPGAVVTVAGWGALSDATGAVSPDKMHFVHLDLLSNRACSTYLSRFQQGISSSMMCALGDGKDSCQGDSGGPLFLDSTSLNPRPIQIGIVSWGLGCGVADSPGVPPFPIIAIDG